MHNKSHMHKDIGLNIIVSLKVWKPFFEATSNNLMRIESRERISWSCTKDAQAPPPLHYARHVARIWKRREKNFERREKKNPINLLRPETFDPLCSLSFSNSFSRQSQNRSSAIYATFQKNHNIFITVLPAISPFHPSIFSHHERKPLNKVLIWQNAWKLFPFSVPSCSLRWYHCSFKWSTRLGTLPAIYLVDETILYQVIITNRV